MFLSLDGTFWIQIINFFIFYAILNRVYIQPAAEALRVRRAYIDRVQRELEDAQRQARELQALADAKNLDAHREAGRHSAEIIGEAQREIERITAETQEHAARLVDEAHAAVEAELAAARSREHALVEELAKDMLARALAPTERRAR